MNGKRLVAVGRICRYGSGCTKDEIVCDPTFADSWHVSVQNAVDALPEVPVHPDYPRLPFVDYEQEADDLAEDMADRDYWRKGGW